MRPAGSPPRHLARTLIASGALLLAGRCALAAEIASIAAIAIVPPIAGAPTRPAIPVDRLERWLKRFIGETCEPAPIEETLARQYRFLGYVPEVSVECDDGEIRTTIRESSHRVDLITFDAEELGSIGVSRAVDSEAPRRRLYPVPPGARREIVRRLLQTRAGDLYNHQRYANDSEALRPLGYVIAFIAGSPGAPGSYPRGGYLIQSTAPRPAEAVISAGDRNYLGGTASYGPRSGGSAGLVFRRRDLLTPLDSLTIAPDYSSEIGGELSYRAPFLADRHDPRRLYELGIGASSNFLRNRLLGGEEVDERRSIGGVSLGIRPLALPAPHEFRWQFSLRHERVDLGQPVDGRDEEELTLLRYGWSQTIRHNFRRPSYTLRIEPAIDFAFDAAGGDREFIRPFVDATLMSRASSGIDLQIHLVAGSIDRSVPEYELWSLGGSETVRGFSEDSFLGRHRAALQTEIWFPFVRTLQERSVSTEQFPRDLGSTPLEPRAASLFKGAVFVDGGYISGTVDGVNLALVGAGVGIRFVVPRQPLVIRLDYGWGLGARGNDSHPYVSLGYRF